MKYFSTRGSSESLTFEETVLTGLAPNGGLYIPENIPSLPENWESEWADFSFQQLSLEILSLYISPNEISREELQTIIQKTYESFRDDRVTPLTKLDENTYVLELFHGPTYAFKDVALQLLGNLFEFFLLRRNARKSETETPEKLTVVGATSGDTGSAAIYGLRGKANVSIFILHPKGKVSPIQEAQMTTVMDANVYNLAVKGTFDDCQDIVKELFADKEFNAKHRLGAVNSINWARILAQTVYYFLSYFDLKKRLGSSGSSFDIQYVVPTGNFGDILAGYYAKRMGLPMGKLVVATNANDILARFWKNGKYEKKDSSSLSSAGDATAPVNGASDGKQTDGVKETLSPAMDILVSSNFERLLWYLAYEDIPSGQDSRREKACATLDGWMTKVKSNGSVEVPTGVLLAAQRDFVADKVTDLQSIPGIFPLNIATIKILQAIKAHFLAEPSYIADPHTAVGLHVARTLAAENPKNTVQIILSTAHPAKFSDAVTLALTSQPNFDFDHVLPDEFRGLLERERRVIDVERAESSLVKAVIEKQLSHRESGTSGVATASV
ncbi:tryptophan synthase beta subunit-like PLP-dependent enzyme [Hygrophoropsis aurantiaca]|uniref:Tryptophan synthase beta subunit-like PLP-dependent enzyme n=1 Tax=Hygrophoropsis aurantiaca TaxID=72124 RepID=A0ACB8ARU8_9AGAM|nr:tryptophan synthase beta subunit-like PLP-dependent enzyme [Hygrophoropsis aurantiaca]